MRLFKKTMLQSIGPESAGGKKDKKIKMTSKSKTTLKTKPTAKTQNEDKFLF